MSWYVTAYMSFMFVGSSRGDPTNITAFHTKTAFAWSAHQAKKNEMKWCVVWEKKIRKCIDVCVCGMCELLPNILWKAMGGNCGSVGRLLQLWPISLHQKKKKKPVTPHTVRLNTQRTWKQLFREEVSALIWKEMRINTKAWLTSAVNPLFFPFCDLFFLPRPPKCNSEKEKHKRGVDSFGYLRDALSGKRCFHLLAAVSFP